ncbi:MAG: DUF4178 domain-containing protein [Pseudomonadota bacterium]
MKDFNCPSCGASIHFQSSVSVSCVCSYCRSLLVRHDTAVELIGTMAQLPDDISPLQIGTTGKYKNIGFTLLGRVKVGWEDGNWNEWFFVTDEGKKGWLAEAQGSLALSFEVEGDDVLDHIPKLGGTFSIHKTVFVVADIKDTTCLGSEGELPVAARNGRVSKVVDLAGPDGEFASAEFILHTPARMYVGEYVEFNQLNLAHLRALPGWSEKALPQPSSQKKHADAGW